MKIEFIGTRGNITARTKKHFRHTTTLITKNRKKLLIDCGKDWSRKTKDIKPDAILITHAHPDHAEGLKKGSPCPVYATLGSWEIIKKYPIKDRRIIVVRKPQDIVGFRVEAFKVAHSLIAPAVGYRISDGNTTIFYVPDLVKIQHQSAALKNIKLYIGDGAIVTRKILIKKRGRTFIGHAPISEQVKWCKKARVPRTIFTHCGTEIVTGDPAVIDEKIKKIEQDYDVPVEIAYDGMVVRIYASRRK